VFQTLSEHRTKQRQQQQRDGGGERCGGGALVFVSSRSQCWLTAIDLIALATASRGGVGQFTTEGNAAVLDGRLSQHRSSIKGTLRWGVGLYYGGMPRADRQLVASLWKDGLLHVLIATPDLAYATLERDFCAPLVIIKGTERYNGTKQCFEAYQQSAVLQMIGRAARRRPIGQGMGAAAAVGGGAAAGGGAAKEKEEEKVTVVVMCQVIPDAAALPPVVFCQLSCSASRHLLSSYTVCLLCADLYHNCMGGAGWSAGHPQGLLGVGLVLPYAAGVLAEAAAPHRRAERGCHAQAVGRLVSVPEDCQQS